MLRALRVRPAVSMLAGASALAFATVASQASAQDAAPAASQTAPDQPTAAADQPAPLSSTDPAATGTPTNGSLPQAADNRSAAIPPADATAGDIVVTGLRQSVATAQATKFNADQFVDSVTATDIGKLPDRNVAEALQRVSGIQITRNYGEGSGIAIRGLTQVKTELNGRDVFGGSGGRALSFEDVPSELLAGVDVYKDPSAKEIEGGIGGLVNLRTRMPFDEKGFVLSTSMGANYFDLAKDARFNGSALVSKTWNDTPIGSIGVLVDLSYYESEFRRDQATIEPYVPVTNATGYEGQALTVPDGAGFQVTNGNRKRKGIYGALQWEPASNVQVYGTYFRSQYDLYTPNYSSFVTNGTSTDYLRYFSPNASGFKFDEDGNFVSGGYNGFIPAYSGIVPGYPDYTQYVNTALNIADNVQVAYSRTVTTDYAGGVKWEPTDRFHVDLDLQYERATAGVQSYTAFAQRDLAGYSIDLSGDLPEITFQTPPGSADVLDLSTYRFTAIMDHLEDSVATQKAGRLDLRWDFDDGFLTSVQGGIRYTDREAVNRSTPYNWTPAAARTVTNPDGTTTTTPYTLADPIARGIPNPYAYDLFGKSSTNIVGAVPFPAETLFDNPAETFQTIGGRAITTFGPLDVNTQREKTYGGYLAAYFQAGSLLDGNLAVRVVKTTNDASGQSQLTYRTDLGGTTGTTTIYEPLEASQNYTRVLPSLNLRAHLTDKLQFRAAASEGLSRPSFYDLRAIRTLSVGYSQVLDPAGNVTGYQPNGTNSGSGGNASLKPLTTEQADIALEWNASRTTFAYGTLFYKKLHNFTTTRVFDVTSDVPGLGSQTFSYTALVNGNKGTVKGFEIGGNTFLDFLPGVLKGFGVQANLTYVDSDAPGDGGTLANGDPVPTQLQGLSKWSYNLVGLYERGIISARLAYNHRSEYLDTIQGNGTGAVPIYIRPYGQLDASLTFNFTPKIAMTVDATNLTRSRFDSYQYYPADPRNYELNDRRFGLSFRIRN